MSHDPDETVRLQIKRRASASEPPRWELVEVAAREEMTVLDALLLARERLAGGAHPLALPVEAGCGDGSCGRCVLLVNGRARQACATRVDDEPQPIELRPLAKLPVVRDLIADRAQIVATLERVGAFSTEPDSPEEHERRRLVDRCAACGACLEACPNWGPHATFLGAAAVHHARLLGLDRASPGGESRLAALSGPGGVHECGHAQNCLEVCPAGLPLTTSLAEAMRSTTRRLFAALLGR